MDPINRVNIDILNRYIQILEDNSFEGMISSEYLLKMCRVAKFNSNWPIDKMSRWLGFIQGVMVLSGLITIAEERELTRPLFHEAYKEKYENIPDSVSI